MADATLGAVVLRTSLDASGLKAGLTQARSETDRAVRDIAQRLDSIGQGMQTLGRRMSLFITAPLTAVGVAGVRSAMQLETFAAALNVLIGDAERANRVFDELYEFSANTPFDWRTLTEATRVLAAFGTEAEDLVPTLSRLGDIAAGTQSDLASLAEIYGRVLVTGRMSMNEVNQLAARGIPIYTELADILGVSADQVRELVSQGKIGFPELERVIRNLTSEGGKFFGMMDAQADTVQGRLNRLKDSFEQVTDIVGERLLPVFDRLINAGQRATEWFVNLDESSQRWIIGLGTGLAASGPILVGVGTLVTQIPKVVAGFQALRTAMLPLLGPAGLLLLVAGGVIALSEALSDPGGRGLEQSLKDAEIAVAGFEQALADAKGDMSDTRVIETLNDSFTSLGENLTGPVKRAFEGMRNELLLTVQEAENSSAALTRIIIGGNLAQDLQQGGLWNARLSAGFRQAGALMFGEDRIIDADQAVLAALLRGDLEEALRISREVERVLARAPQSGVIEGISEFVTHLEGVINRLEQPVSTNVNVGMTASTPLETGSGYDALGIPKDGSTREVEVVVTVRTAQTAEELFGALAGEGTAVNRAVARLGGRPEQVLEGLRRRAELFEAAMQRAWEIPDLTVAEFDYLVRRGAELEESARVFEHAMSVSRMMGPDGTRGPLPDIEGPGTSLYQRVLQRGMARFAEIDRALLAAADEPPPPTLNERVRANARRRFAEIDRALLSDPPPPSLNERVRAAARARFAEIDRALLAEWRRPLDPGASFGLTTVIPRQAGGIADAWADHLEDETERLAARFRSMDITTTNTDLAIRRERELAMERERLAKLGEEARMAEERRWRDIVASQRWGGDAARRYTEQANLQAAAIRLAAQEGITLTEALQRLTGTLRNTAEQVEFNARVGQLSLQLGRRRERESQPDSGGLIEAGRILKDRADEAGRTFMGLVLAAGQGLKSIFQEIAEGDTGDAIKAGFDLFGDIGSVLLPAFGPLIKFGTGLMGDLFSWLFGGGQSDRERAEREQRRVGNVPAIELHFTVNQTNTYNGAPSQPENEQAFRRQAITLWEELYRRHLGPRLDRIEQRLGIAGAPA